MHKVRYEVLKYIRMDTHCLQVAYVLNTYFLFYLYCHSQRQNNSVLKNTLLKRAFNELNITAFDEDLNGSTSVAFGVDETQAAKVACDMCKSTNDKISVKSGWIDGAYVDAKGVKAFASIPSREVLVAKLAGALSSIIGGLAVALNQVAEKKEQNA